MATQTYAQALANLQSSGLTGNELAMAEKSLQSSYATAPTTAAAPAATTAPPATGASIGTYKGQPIYGGTDAQIQAQEAAIDNPAPAAGSSTGSTTSSGISVPSTGDPSLDKVQSAITSLANTAVASGYSIPTSLQITPALVSTFLSMAQQAIDPDTQQLLASRLADINADLQNQATQYNASVGQTEQNFGASLGAEEQNAADTGTAFSSSNDLAQNNLVNSTNRSLASLASSTGASMGSDARAAAADLGAANLSGIQLPSLSTGQVSNLGSGSATLGSTVGGTSTGGALNLNYDPSIYTVGNIPTQQAQAVNQQQQSYLSQYGTLAGNNSNSGQTAASLIGMMSGLPSGYTLPSGLT